MKIVHTQDIVRRGELADSEDMQNIFNEIKDAIGVISWPPGADGFYLDPSSKGKGRGEGRD